MMTVSIFAILLLLGSLFSGTASRSAVSISVLFLGASVLLGPGVLGRLKGFASVIHAIVVLDAGPADANLLFRLVALVVIVSIVVHSSADVAVALARAGRETPPGTG